MYLSSSALKEFSNKPPYSNCAKVIMLPVCSWYDVAYRIYENVGLMASASQYGHYVYANVLERVLSDTTSRE